MFLITVNKPSTSIQTEGFMQGHAYIYRGGGGWDGINYRQSLTRRTGYRMMLTELVCDITLHCLFSKIINARCNCNLSLQNLHFSFFFFFFFFAKLN